MKKHEKTLIAIIVVLGIAIASVSFYDLFYLGNISGTNTSTTNSFITEPVADIIIPFLFKQGATGGLNTPLNLTRGQSENLTVEVYPIVSLNVSMTLSVYLLASQNTSSGISGTFVPDGLSIQGGKSANTTMIISVSSEAKLGSYNAIVSATNEGNHSQTWGDVFMLNVKS